MDLARLGFPNKTKPYLQQTKIASLRLKDWTKKLPRHSAIEDDGNHCVFGGFESADFENSKK